MTKLHKLMDSFPTLGSKKSMMCFSENDTSNFSASNCLEEDSTPLALKADCMQGATAGTTSNLALGSTVEVLCDDPGRLEDLVSAL